MNQATMEALAILVRQFVMAGGTALGISGALTPYVGPLTNLIIALLLVGGSALWSQFAQRFKRSKLMQALEEANTSEAKIETMVRSAAIPTPSVMTAKDVIPFSLPRG